MVSPSSKSLLLQNWIDRLRGGDAAARDELLNASCERLRQIVRKMLKRYPRVRRWEQTDDVLQNVSLRLCRTLADVTPADVRDFLRLASLNIRRELLDLVKHYCGPLGLGTHHRSSAGEASPDVTGAEPGTLAHEPTRLAAWSAFHEAVEGLPDDEREVFDLLWYHGLAHTEAAELLGVNERTVRRRWQDARLHVAEALHGEIPPGD
jgi:RNA polymerase sigma-70 factor (ECF subfamily)